MTKHVAYPGCYCVDCVEGMPHERHADNRGYIVGNGDRTRWRAWVNGEPTWVDDPADATRYGFRSDANAVHAEDEDAWCVVKYEDIATPSARITGDKDRGNPVEGAPHTPLGAALVYAQARITALEAEIARKDALLEKVAQAAIDASARIIERRMDRRFEEFGTREWDTNACYYQGQAAETYEDRDEQDEEAIAAIRALSPKAIVEGVK